MKLGEKAILDFLTVLNKLEPVEIAAIGKILCVKLANEEGEPRVGREVVNDMIDSFSSLARKQRRELMKVMRQAAKSKAKIIEGEQDGADAEHPEES